MIIVLGGSGSLKWGETSSSARSHRISSSLGHSIAQTLGLWLLCCYFKGLGYWKMEIRPEPPDYSGVLYVVPVPAKGEAEARQLLRNREFIWRQGKEWCSQAPALPEEVSGGFCHSDSQETLEALQDAPA